MVYHSTSDCNLVLWCSSKLSHHTYKKLRLPRKRNGEDIERLRDKFIGFHRFALALEIESDVNVFLITLLIVKRSLCCDGFWHWRHVLGIDVHVHGWIWQDHQMLQVIMCKLGGCQLQALLYFINHSLFITCPLTMLAIVMLQTQPCTWSFRCPCSLHGVVFHII